MIVIARPSPNYTYFLSKNKLKQKYFNKNLNFFKYGREALLFGFKTIGLKKNDKIIVPAYMCDTTLNPLRDFGFKLVFLDVDENLNLPFDQFKRKVQNDKKIKGVLLVHYFGFIFKFDEIIEFCKVKKLVVAEDCSHSFLSHNFFNHSKIKSDFMISSARKMIPVKDGGMLIFQKKKYAQLSIDKKVYLSKFHTISYLLSRFAEKIAVCLGINIYSKKISQIKFNVQDRQSSKSTFVKDQQSIPSKMLSYFINNSSILEKIKKNVLHNHSIIFSGLSNLNVQYFFNRSLQKGVIPQAFIIYDNKGGLVQYLKEHGIGAWRWPGKELSLEVKNNSKLYLNSNFFDQKLVLIPIHFSLKQKHLNYMIEKINKYNS